MGRGAWFEDFPLDFSRADTREAEEALLAAYPDVAAQTRLAENSGVELAVLNTNTAPKYLIRDVLKRASIAGRLVRLVAEVLKDKPSSPTAKKLAAQFAGHEAKLAAAIREDAEASYAWLAAAPPAIEVARPGQRPVPLAGLEETINAAAGFQDVTAFLRGLTVAQARTARILVGGKPKGTGFLVAADKLLTNWHVVMDATHLAAQFDYRTNDKGVEEGRTVTCALDYHSPFGDLALELGPDGPPPGACDYALLHLDARVGAEGLGTNAGQGEPRGWFELDGSSYDFDAKEPIFIMGHPEGSPMRLSYAAPSNVRLTKHATRLRYDTNTEPGSSGSPVFNKAWRVVALHHASGPTKTPGVLDVADGRFNQGIPIARIVADLSDKVRADIQDALSGRAPT